jgi:hypothetical protein
MDKIRKRTDFAYKVILLITASLKLVIIGFELVSKVVNYARRHLELRVLLPA